MKATSTPEIINGVEYRVILSIEGQPNKTTIFTTRKAAKVAIKRIESDLQAGCIGYVVRLICNVYEDGELIIGEELGRCQYDPSKVIKIIINA